ncbi:MAG: hypothetical protein LBJ67_11990 [Planctomycetaceae bacterium]|jgi:hypothetical protein|nr:hypothetical protein [Planctomycetaceae bacterium]
MQNGFLKFYLLGCMTVAVVLLSDHLVAYGQLRTPPQNVKELAAESNNQNEREAVWQAMSTDTTIAKQEKNPTVKIAQSPSAYSQQVDLQSLPSTAQASTQTIAPTPTQQTSEQIHVQLIAPPQVVGFSPGIIPPGTIVIPVTIPQYVPPVVNQPAQLIILPQLYPPMYSMPYPPQYFPPQNTAGFYPYAGYGYPSIPSPPVQQQPIPTRMILPDGSTVSIKHYVPGSFLKNVWRAVTP